MASPFGGAFLFFVPIHLFNLAEFAFCIYLVVCMMRHMLADKSKCQEFFLEKKYALGQ